MSKYKSGDNVFKVHLVEYMDNCENCEGKAEFNVGVLNLPVSCPACSGNGVNTKDIKQRYEAHSFCYEILEVFEEYGVEHCRLYGTCLASSTRSDHLFPKMKEAVLYANKKNKEIKNK